MISQRLQSEDEDAESIAEKLDIFPPSRSGYTQKVSGSWHLAVVSRIVPGIWLTVPGLQDAADSAAVLCLNLL
jgi:hypothetical protein